MAHYPIDCMLVFTVFVAKRYSIYDLLMIEWFGLLTVMCGFHKDADTNN